MNNQYIGTAGAARLLGVSQQAVHRLVQRGRLAAVWVDGRRLYRVDAVEALLRDPAYLAKSRSRGRDVA